MDLSSPPGTSFWIKQLGNAYSAIDVVLPDGTNHLARMATPMTADSVGQDYAILKVDGVSGLSFLPLGSIKGVVLGSDATIIGFPFSAITPQGHRVYTKFCLSANIAASDIVTIPVNGTKPGPQGDVPFKVDVKVEVIYFQGPSVKGISGSPIISRDTGKVIGIVTQKLTGIGHALDALRQDAAHPVIPIQIAGVGDPNQAFIKIIDVLDDQLANGLGAATGIDDPAHTLNMVKAKK
jgi:hypothetical protein